jgi:hypothetical protein
MGSISDITDCWAKIFEIFFFNQEEEQKYVPPPKRSTLAIQPTDLSNKVQTTPPEATSTAVQHGRRASRPTTAAAFLQPSQIIVPGIQREHGAITVAVQVQEIFCCPEYQRRRTYAVSSFSSVGQRPNLVHQMGARNRATKVVSILSSY